MTPARHQHLRHLRRRRDAPARRRARQRDRRRRPGQKQVFAIDLAGATNIASDAADNGEDPQLEAQNAAGVRAVSKRLVVDLVRFGYDHDKPEVVGLFPNGDLAVQDDNDFGFAQGNDPGTAGRTTRAAGGSPPAAHAEWGARRPLRSRLRAPVAWPASQTHPMAPVRILILSWEYPPLIEGGLARHVRKLSEQLVQQDVEVHVLTRGDEAMSAQQLQCGVHVHRVREPSKPRDLTEFVAWIEHMNADMLAAGLELGERLDFDLVHGHDWLVAVAGDKLARALDCPWVVTIHATEYGRHQGWVDKHPQTYIHGVERWITNRSDRVIACSHYMREQIADIFGVDEGRVSVIPNGIDPDDLQPQDPEELIRLRSEFAEPGEKLVLLIGRLVYEKGFQLALEAMPRLIEEVPGTRFLIAGSGTHEAELHKQAEELGLMEHGTFLGWIGDDVLHSLYRIADLCLVPSIYEPFGLVALEAMASGCLCIVADTGGLREVVPGDGSVGLRFR
ncbi:MAG TPA: glycosyltransferase, partial [Conexibacter sp.]|nr:glycosyltransferase [Conexibacter sp.]